MGDGQASRDSTRMEEGQWVINGGIVDGLRLGVRDGDGFVIECAPAMFNKGDFCRSSCDNGDF